jgi:hypothetical protein
MVDVRVRGWWWVSGVVWWCMVCVISPSSSDSIRTVPCPPWSGFSSRTCHMSHIQTTTRQDQDKIGLDFPWPLTYSFPSNLLIPYRCVAFVYTYTSLSVVDIPCVTSIRSHHPPVHPPNSYTRILHLSLSPITSHAPPPTPPSPNPFPNPGSAARYSIANSLLSPLRLDVCESWLASRLCVRKYTPAASTSLKPSKPPARPSPSRTYKSSPRSGSGAPDDEAAGWYAW